VRVPAGEFRMGSTKAGVEAAWNEFSGDGDYRGLFDDELPQHNVYLPFSFFMMKDNEG
jgi:formylglycine-generating enzyme required for sulfatase activity